MTCRKYEQKLIGSLDRRLNPEEEKDLRVHLENCPSCQKKEAVYRQISETLKSTVIPEPKPYFWQRLRPRLQERPVFEPWALWKRWCLRAIPVSLMLVAAGVIALFIPQNGEELSQSEALLLRNLNPLQETRMILEQEGAENQSMMLIFTSLEERNGQRRYVP